MKKPVALVLLGMLLFSLSAPAQAAGEAEDDYQALEAQYQALYEERAEAVLQGDSEKIIAVEQRMEAAGITFLNDLEIAELTGEPVNTGVQLFANLGTSTKVTWSSYRLTVPYNGVNYNIQTVTAQGKEDVISNLSSSDNVSSKAVSGFQAANKNLIKSVASSALNLVPNAAWGVTFYDAASGYIEGLKKTTIVKNVTASYLVGKVQSAQFKYVRKSSDNDNSQGLTYVSTLAKVEVAMTLKSFKSDAVTVKPGSIHRVYYKALTPTYYGNNTYAIERFLGKNVRSSAIVPNYTITLADGAKHTIKMAQPKYPLDIK